MFYSLKFNAENKEILVQFTFGEIGIAFEGIDALGVVILAEDERTQDMCWEVHK